MGEIVRFKHSCNSGDLVASMPGVKYCYDQMGKKGVIMQRINVEAAYYLGAVHPIKDSKGDMVCMNEKQWGMLKPLLEAQEYIERCEIWEGQEFDINFDTIREGTYVNMAGSPIETWQFMVHPLLTCDISKPWLKVPVNVNSYKLGNGKEISASEINNYIIINRTERYQNAIISYFFLKGQEHRLIFAGTPKERDLFCDKFKLKIPLLIVKDFLELAQALATCKLVICNQSMIFNICNAMKTPRLLEMCLGAFNCFAIGANGYSFLHQKALEILYNKLIK